MKRRLELILIAVLVLGAAGALVLTRNVPAPSASAEAAEIAAAGGQTTGHAGGRTQPASETTIRNVTDKTITYKIYPISRPQDLKTHEITPGTIHRYPTSEALGIEFNTGAADVVYSLDAGKPYSFRYDGEVGIDLFLGSHGRADAVDLAPWVPSPDLIVSKMLEVAGVTGKDVLYDIGCGDGRIVITAARKFGAKGVGIDIDKSMVETSVARAKKAGVSRLVKFICMDATKADVSEATVVTLYLLPESNALMRPILDERLRPGARVVCHNYPIPGWEAKRTQSLSIKDEEGTDHNIYLYIR